MNKDLLKLFEADRRFYHAYEPPFYRSLKGTRFTYVHRRTKRWLVNTEGLIRYVSFEHVMDSVSKEIQMQLLFHLDYFTGEVKEDG